MSTAYLSINYFPITVNFFETDAIELAEAQYGIKVDGAICKLLCKIFKEGYYIQWGDEQSMIFARKLGGEINAKEMNGIIWILLDKGFFDQKSYNDYRILTSAEIQRVWMEATSRRKRDISSLPYLLIGTDKSNVSPKEELNSENENILPENADNSKQSIVEQRKAREEEENNASLSIEIPEYARNGSTHNVKGLLESLAQHGVTNQKEITAILKLSDYGRKGTKIWITLSSTKWAKIESPGRYIISTLRN